MSVTTSDLLTTHPFLAGMSPEQLAKLAPWGHRAVFPEGARLFTDGGKADRFWLLREGQVALAAPLPDGGQVVIDRLGPGAVLGWSWLFPPYRWHLRATADTQVLAAEMDAAGIRRICAEDPQIAAELYRRFIEVVVNRLHATRERLTAPGPAADA